MEKHVIILESINYFERSRLSRRMEQKVMLRSALQGLPSLPVEKNTKVVLIDTKRIYM